MLKRIAQTAGFAGLLALPARAAADDPRRLGELPGLPPGAEPTTKVTGPAGHAA